MQQTEKYKLNLIEKTDTFSPDALNQNTQKVEEVLAGEETARTAADSALAQRVTTLEAKKIVFGTFVASIVATTINVGFTPAAIIVSAQDVVSHPAGFVLIPGYLGHYSGSSGPIIVENGFEFRGVGDAGSRFFYIAFG